MAEDKPRKGRSRIRTVLIILLLILVAFAMAWVFGPRTPVDLSVRFDPATIGSDVDTWLAEQEGNVPDLRENATKEIVWAYPESRAKTPVSIVYLHGFSAAKGELRPVPDMAAAELGANLYYARLAGHGRDGDAMAEPSVNDWIQDLAEAVAIGERIGEKVVIVATSTGASLAVLAASLPEFENRIAGFVLVSPNFRIRAAGSGLLTWPFGGTIARIVIGAERGFDAQNEVHGQNWTTRYPTSALMPMAAMVNRAGALPFEQFSMPALFVYHPDDGVVDETVTAEIADRWGGPVTVLELEATDDPYNHVVAGDILSPSNNETVATAIVEFARSL